MRKRKAKAKGANLGESVTSLSMQAQLAGWATPLSTSSRGNPDVQKWIDRKAKDRPGSTAVTELNMQAQLTHWPTPKSNDADRGGSTEHMDGRRSNLSDTVHASSWPTPLARDAKGAKGPSMQTEGGPDLGTTARRSTGPTSTGSRAPTASRGQLNPEHSRWLMGYPAAWGCCAVTATPSSRSSRPSSSQWRSPRTRSNKP